ncbi:hypothetical protein M9435_001373 [Picochlorum sp. BPE23]|nr:hypothetical protein M9435_001373 [Picochlorum sp. BPE23]
MICHVTRVKGQDLSQEASVLLTSSFLGPDRSTSLNAVPPRWREKIILYIKKKAEFGFIPNSFYNSFHILLSNLIPMKAWILASMLVLALSARARDGNQTAGIAGSVSQCSLTSTGLIGQCTETFSNTSVVPLSSNTFILPSQETRAGAGSVATLVSYCEGLEGGIAAVKDNGPPIPQKSMDSGIIFSVDVLVPPNSTTRAFRSTNYSGPNVFLSTLYSGIQGCLLDVESLEIQDCIDIISDPQILYPMVSVNTLSLRAYLPDANQTVLGCNVNATTGAFDQCSAMSEKFDVPTAIAFTNNQTIAYIVSSNATFDLLNGTPTIEGPGYVTVCQVDAIGEFENCKVAIAGLSAPTSVSFFENLAFISQSGTDTITTCNVSEDDGTFDDCKDSATKFTNPSAVEVVVRG